MAEGVKATVGTLETGASIQVEATGVFTSDFANADAADAAKAFFTAVEGKYIAVEGKALSCVEGDDPGVTPPTLEETINAMSFDGTNNTQVCPLCETEVTWTAITANSAFLIGNSTSTAH